MRRSVSVSLLTALLLALTLQQARAQMPETIAYQGYLTDADDMPLDGAIDLTFRLYDAATGGAARWLETQANVAFADGVFSTALGRLQALDEVAFDGPLWLSVAVGDAGAEELAPRVALRAVPYSLHARTLADEALLAGANVTIEREGGALLISAAAADSASGWRLGGNAGTNPSEDFIGTSDETALELRVNGVRALRVEPATYAGFGFVPNVIGGSSANSVGEGAAGATIAGGGANDFPNIVGDSFATVGGGANNEAGGTFAVIGGGGSNKASGKTTVIGGGESNEASGDLAAIAGGIGNEAGGKYTTIAGGTFNIASGILAYIGGGEENEANGSHTIINGGAFNTASDIFAIIGGGINNEASGEYAIIGGGTSNEASGEHAIIGGGANNEASGNYAMIPGGRSNEVAGSYSFAAGRRAKALHDGAFVWADNTTADLASTAERQFLIRAGGGVGIGTNAPTSPLTVAGVIESTEGGIRFPDGSTQASAGWAFGGNAGTDPSVDYIGTSDEAALELRVNGERALRIEPTESTPNWIGGASNNAVAEGVVGATLAGGFNIASANYATVGGGVNNSAHGLGSVIAGGGPNTASDAGAIVNGGSFNTASGAYAIIGGGSTNEASEEWTIIGGGKDNTASGAYAIIPGGQSNEAAGAYSFAAGHRAKALHDGAFVWAGDSNASFASTAEDQFLIRATGGVGVGTNAPQAALHVVNTQDGIDLIVGGTSNSTQGDDGIIASDPAYDSSDLFFHTNDAFVIRLDHDGSGEDADFYIRDKDDNNLFEVDESGNVTVLGTVSDGSDRNRKERIEALDPRHVLEEVARLPLYRWSYRGESIRHVGPMAQDFYAAFGVGRDETSIATVDADGVALAAIQALHERVQAQDRLIEALTRRLQALEQDQP